MEEISKGGIRLRRYTFKGVYDDGLALFRARFPLDACALGCGVEVQALGLGGRCVKPHPPYNFWNPLTGLDGRFRPQLLP